MRRKILLVVGGALALLVLAGVVVASGGSRQTYDRADGPAPAWAKPCFGRSPRTDRPLLHFCARIRGRVLHSRHTHPTVTHVAVVAHFRIVIIRLETGHAPRLGSEIIAVGPLLRIKYGLPELQAFSVSE
jgi:hypothetical protein